ncbi:hypothetical protein EBZ80_01310 [bacterium]|nr:hypothetical protein [bacterium]
MITTVLIATIVVLFAIIFVLSLVIVLGYPRELPFQPFEMTVDEMIRSAKTGDLMLFRFRQFEGIMYFTFFTHVGMVIVGADGKKRLLETNPWWGLTPGVPFGDAVVLLLEHRIRSDLKSQKIYFYPLVDALPEKKETEIREAVDGMAGRYPPSPRRFVSDFTMACVRRKNKKKKTMNCSQLAAEALGVVGLTDVDHSCIVPDHFVTHPAYGSLYELTDDKTSEG